MAEDISLREQNVKHFRLANGSYEAVIYPQAIHRQDSAGVWRDIDNSVHSMQSNGKNVLSTSDSRVVFAESFKANEALFTLKENEYTITAFWRTAEDTSITEGEMQSNILLPQAVVTNAVPRNEKQIFDTLNEAREINNKSSVFYDNVDQNTALEYVLVGNDIKENIIVKAPKENYSYAFELRLGGLEAELNENGEINIFDSKTRKGIYVIPAPYMYDSNGVLSYDVFYDLVAVSEGRYLLVVQADDSWINDTSRVFPVTIDPTIAPREMAFDAYIDAEKPDKNYGYESKLWVSDTKTTYIYIDIPYLPDDATLISASLHAAYYFNYSWPPATDYTGSILTGAYQVQEFWYASDITYNTAPGLISTPLSTAILYEDIMLSSTSPGRVSYPITAAVASWLDDYDTHGGIAIKREASTVHTKPEVVFKPYQGGQDYLYITMTYTPTLPDCVYAFRHTRNQTRYITVEDDYEFAGKHIQQTELTVSPTIEFDQSSLFKISNVPGTERFVIRSMLNNNLSFKISGTEVITTEIPAIDADVNPSDTFLLVWDGFGYVIQPYGSVYALNMPSTSTENLSVVTMSGAHADASWEMVQYTGAHRYGTTVYHPEELVAGETVTVTAVTWSTYIGCNQPHFSINSTPAGIATSAWNSATRTASVTLHDEGSLSMIVRIYNGSTITGQVQTHTKTIVLPWEEGMYLLRNRAAPGYLQIRGDDSSLVGALMKISSFSGDNVQKWQLIHLIDGFYKIVSAESDLALSVKNGEINMNEANIVQEPYANLSRQMWKITNANDDAGAQVIRPKSAMETATDWCLNGAVVLDGIEDFGVAQTAYTNDAERSDEWWVAKIGYESPLAPEEQEKEKWCWVTAARMLAKHYATIDDSKTQTAAVTHVKGNNEDIGGNAIDICAAINYYLSDTGCSQEFGYPGGIDVYSKETLVRFLNDGHVIIIGRHERDDIYLVNSNVGHTILIYGYIVLNGDAHFLIRDPAGCQTYIVSYDWLYNGRNRHVYDQRPEDDYIWTSTVVAKTEYFDDTELYRFD